MPFELIFLPSYSRNFLMNNIRINYLYEEHVGDWSAMYNRGVRKALEPFDACYYDVTGYLPDQVLRTVREARHCDIWYSFSISDLLLAPLAEQLATSPSKLLIHNHGGMETGDYEALLWGDDDTQVLREICGHPRVRMVFNSNLNFMQFIAFYDGPILGNAVGFPLDVPDVQVGYDRSGIAVCGRPSIGKQVFLAAKILEPYKEQTTFLTGRTDFAETKKVLRRKGYQVERVWGDAYYDRLAKMRIGFCATLADSFGITNYEMVALGMPVIVPDLPIFNAFPTSWKYRPYDVYDALEKVGLALAGEVAPPKLADIYSDGFAVNIQRVIKEMMICTSHW
jgi:hypothetical protein